MFELEVHLRKGEVDALQKSCAIIDNIYINIHKNYNARD